MTTSTLEIGNLFSVLGVQGIEKQLQRITGIKVQNVSKPALALKPAMASA